MTPATRLALSICALLAAPIADVAASEPPAEAQRVLTVRRGDTLGELLTSAGIGQAEAHEAIGALATVFPPRSLAVGQEVGLRLAPDRDNALLALEIEPAPGRTIALRRQGDRWVVEEQVIPRQRHLARIEAPIIGGVYLTLTRAGMPAPLTHALIRALSHEVDFQRDIQPGDRIAVAFERLRAPDGDLLGHGQLLHASLTLSGRELSVWRHVEADGDAAWYYADGRPLAGGFLRTPLDGARLTSGFGMRRHPVLGFSRRHEGLDFAAPPGTPIYAAADGVVAAARMERGYGRTVRLRHPGGIETVYAHMSRFARNLKPGDRVRQGDVIGAVGSSGMSTGPHLHYEIRLAGRAQDPARAALPAGERLRGTELAAFHDRRRELNRQMAQIASGRTEVALAGD
ncbi:M23 family metallopeptidase [Falsiroseomonas stagni]|uniref:Murein DD-endopeptidase MepM and murein hydrolase activator NlpD, contain LysM domain n=1 Tax=Falsiroseomonas stagni DSM 19981 TaxID=1123062 RepID=A0A1I4EKM9_9PROT|nr:M23 family metallopeptidase [Falsiroseomonas stagni]SFL06274.1 Murein DD-endopeptidase MepM and murein hydrolase activator NlpD, contain LysM domain [Falsiroseomonas stagni DSM 19981]